MKYSISIPWSGWEAVKVLGKGSFGTVYEIQRNDSGVEEKAALKVIPVPQNLDELYDLYGTELTSASIEEWCRGRIENIKKEYSVLIKLKGARNIVRCEDMAVVSRNDAEGYNIYIRMELLEPLNKLLRTKELSEDETVRLAADICRALSTCERHNIVHRDIKPENILVGENGEFKIGDFGIARELDHTTAASRTGTPPYMAPEMVLGRKYGRTVDIYALGILLYRLLNNNKLPFWPADHIPDPNEIERAFNRRLSGEQFPEPARGSREFRRIIMKACAFAPEDRYQTADEMLADINRMIACCDTDETVSMFHIPERENGQDGTDTIVDDDRSVVITNDDSDRSKPEPDPEPKPDPGRKWIWIGAALLAVCVIAVVMISRMPGDDASGESVGNDAVVEDTDASQADETADIYAAYTDVLEGYEYEIKGYHWQYDSNSGSSDAELLEGPRGISYVENPVNKCIALHDLENDGMPELLFMALDGSNSACLHIYTYTEGKAEECYYAFLPPKEDWAGFINSRYFTDAMVEAGTRYAVFAGSSSGDLYIKWSYAIQCSANGVLRIHMDPKDIYMDSEVIGHIEDGLEDGSVTNKYYRDDSEISSDEYNTAVESAASDFGDLIMYSGPDEYANNDSPSAMCYGDAIEYLRN